MPKAVIIRVQLRWLASYIDISFSEMNSISIFVLLVLIACCISWQAVGGNPHTISDIEHTEVASNKKKRDLGASAVVAAIFGIGLISMSISNQNKCSVTAGCHKSYCWAWCGVNLSGGEWCYTTKIHSQSYKYVSCEYDYDCDECWKCGGPCTL